MDNMTPLAPYTSPTTRTELLAEFIAQTHPHSVNPSLLTDMEFWVRRSRKIGKLPTPKGINPSFLLLPSGKDYVDLVRVRCKKRPMVSLYELPPIARAYWYDQGVEEMTQEQFRTWVQGCKVRSW